MKVCGDKPEMWAPQAPPAFFADKVSTNKVTGCTPFYILHGVQPVLPFDLTEVQGGGRRPRKSSADII